MGTDENLFRLVVVPEHGARVLRLELVPVPGYGAEIGARAPTKGYIQAGALRPGTLARAPSLTRGGYPFIASCLYYQQ